MFEDEKLKVQKYKKFENNNRLLDWYALLTSRKVIVIITLIVILFFAHIMPTKETMKCDQKYICKVEKQYLWFLPVNKTIRLSKKSKMTTKVNYSFIGSFLSGGRHSRHRSKYRGYIYVTNKDRRKVPVFTYYVSEYRYSDNVQNFLDSEEEKFQKYIENPEQGYETKSLANPFVLALLFTFAIIIFVMKKLDIPIIGPRRRRWW